jgi:hypothetical protein
MVSACTVQDVIETAKEISKRSTGLIGDLQTGTLYIFRRGQADYENKDI